MKDSFYEDEVKEIDWDDEPFFYDDENELYLLTYRDEKKIKKNNKNQGKIIKKIDRFLKLIKEEKKKERDGFFDGIKSIDELNKSKIAEKLVLDKYIYYINTSRYNSIYIIGDLHGSKMAFKALLEEIKPDNDDNLLVFLGDYIDRGGESLWILYHILKLKDKYPEKIILLKGNHEYFEKNGDKEYANTASPADLFEHINNSIIIKKEHPNLKDLLDESMINENIEILSENLKTDSSSVNYTEYYNNVKKRLSNNNESDSKENKKETKIEEKNIEIIKNKIIDNFLLKREKFYNDKFKEKVFGDFFSSLAVGAFLIKDDKNIFLSHSGFLKPDVDPAWNDLETNSFDYYKMKKEKIENFDRFKDTDNIGKFNNEKNREALVWTRFSKAEYKMSYSGSRGKEIGVYSQCNFMDKFNIDIIIRGHSHPNKGIDKVSYNRDKSLEIYTIFSGGNFEDCGNDFKNHKTGYILIENDGKINEKYLKSINKNNMEE